MNVVPLFPQKPKEQSEAEIVAHLNRSAVGGAVARMRREIIEATNGHHGLSREVKLALADLYKAVAADLAMGCWSNDV